MIRGKSRWNFLLYFLYRIRMEFNTQRIATPVSANTASHMEAIPMSPSTMTSAFTASANTTFWLEIAPVLFAILIAGRDRVHAGSHKYDISSLDRGIRTTAHRSSDVGACENRCVIDPIADEYRAPLSARSFCRISSLSAGRSFA